MANKYAQSTGNWSAGGGGGIWYDANSGGSVVAKPTTGDNAYICASAVVTIDENVACDLIAPDGNNTSGQIKIADGSTGRTIAAALTSGYTAAFLVWGTGTCNLTITGNVTHSGSGTGANAMLPLVADKTLTINGKVLESGTGHAIYNNNGTVNISVAAGQTALESTGTNSNSHTLSVGAGTANVTGNLVQSGSNGYVLYAAGTVNITGTMSTTTSVYACRVTAGVTTLYLTAATDISSSSTPSAVLWVSGGSLVINNNSQPFACSMTGATETFPILTTAGSITWIGSATIAEDTDASIAIRGGTLYLATAAGHLDLANSGTLVISLRTGTLTVTDATGGTAVITNQTEDAQAALLYCGATAKDIVVGPTIPAEEDVETGVEYGYSGDLQTGTLAAGGGGVPVFGGNVARRV